MRSRLVSPISFFNATTDVIVKGGILFAITVAFAVVGWNIFPSAPWILAVAALGGLGLGLVNALKKKVSPPLIMLYAVLQGLFLGGISNWYNAYAQGNGYNGLVLQAVLGTMTAFGNPSGGPAGTTPSSSSPRSPSSCAGNPSAIPCHGISPRGSCNGP